LGIGLTRMAVKGGWGILMLIALIAEVCSPWIMLLSVIPTFPGMF